MILERREFLKRLGYMMVGGLIVPYVPKVFYSIPSETIRIPYIISSIPYKMGLDGPIGYCKCKRYADGAIEIISYPWDGVPFSFSGFKLHLVTNAE